MPKWVSCSTACCMMSQSLSLPITTPTLGASLRRAMDILEEAADVCSRRVFEVPDFNIGAMGDPDGGSRRLVASRELTDNVADAGVVVQRSGIRLGRGSRRRMPLRVRPRSTDG